MAVETADVVLMTEDLQKIPHMIRVSRQSVFTIQQNFYGTLSVDGLGFILAATGNLNPLFAYYILYAQEYACSCQIHCATRTNAQINSFSKHDCKTSQLFSVFLFVC